MCHSDGNCQIINPSYQRSGNGQVHLRSIQGPALAEEWQDVIENIQHGNVICYISKWAPWPGASMCSMAFWVAIYNIPRELMCISNCSLQSNIRQVSKPRMMRCNVMTKLLDIKSRLLKHFAKPKRQCHSTKSMLPDHIVECGLEHQRTAHQRTS